ncbi:MAG TPA: hypothetical protein VFG59_15660 [Anaeromyxobacter sp.]|nr:hypothetical protein [Anaeromyxobacter sp.]
MPADAPSQQVQPPAPPAQKPSVLPKVLVGCLAVVVVVGLVISVAVWWGMHKLHGFVGDAQKNPAVFAAKLIAAANPDLEVASEDNAHQTVTIRNKKTGETITMNAQDLKAGKLRFKNEKGEELTVQGEGEKGALTMTSKEGTVTMGGAAGPLPPWVPAFPGAKPSGVMSKKTATGVEGALVFATDKKVEEVLDFYGSELERKGFTVERSASDANGTSMGSIAAKSESDQRTVNVGAVSSGQSTQVNLQYSGK